MTDDYIKLPRLYVDGELKTEASLGEGPAHYLRSVLRLSGGARLRLFNGRDGEWLGEIAALDKKAASVRLLEQIKKQPSARTPVHLLFAPIKKDRLDFLIEKSVELGVTDLHPIVTNRTEIRKVNNERLQAQITEAAEQCERLDLPALHALSDLPVKLAGWDSAIPLLACIERAGAPVLRHVNPPAAILIGPEGGFDESEKAALARYAFIKPVSLGDSILRAETAALKALSLVA
jgi:16S rRNA (uracil1498-N3)-methyltransferase